MGAEGPGGRRRRVFSVAGRRSYRVEVVHGDVRLRTDGVRHRPGVLNKLCSADDARLLDAPHRVRGHVLRKVLVAEDRETFLDAIREVGISLEETTRVLVVDDDADAREIIGRVLSAQGVEYAEAKNGAEALNMVNDGFSMIVLDLDMPVMNGFEFMRSIDGLDNLKDIPIIVFSGMELDAEQSETVNQYTAGIINKTDLDHEDRLTELLGNLIAVKPES